MKSTAILNELRDIRKEISAINSLIKLLIKKECERSIPPQPFIAEEKYAEAEKLRLQNPREYDYVMEIIKLLF